MKKDRICGWCSSYSVSKQIFIDYVNHALQCVKAIGKFCVMCQLQGVR